MKTSAGTELTQNGPSTLSWRNLWISLMLICDGLGSSSYRYLLSPHVSSITLLCLPSFTILSWFALISLNKALSKAILSTSCPIVKAVVCPCCPISHLWEVFDVKTHLFHTGSYEFSVGVPQTSDENLALTLIKSVTLSKLWNSQNLNVLRVVLG